MTEEAKPKTLRSWARRLAVAAGVTTLALVASVVAVRVWVMTPPGRGMVAGVLDGLSLGSLGVLRIEGFAGDPLHDARIARLTISDADGVWVVIEDAHLVWRPRALLGRTFRIDALEAETVRVARRPAGGERGGSGGGDWGVVVRSLALPRIELAEPVLGTAAVLAADARLDVARSGAIEAAVDLRRTDLEGDRLLLEATRSAGGAGRLEAELTALAEGPLARLVRMPSQTIRARAELAGDVGAGEGRIEASLGDAPFVDASGTWAGDAGRATATVRFAAAPELAALAERFGPQASADLTLGAIQGGLRPMMLEARSDGLTLSAQGDIDPARRAAPGGLAVVADAPSVSRLIGDTLDDRPLAIGAAHVDGRVAFEDGFSFEGDVDGADVAYGDWRAARASGPATVAYGGGRASVAADLAAEGVVTPEAFGDLFGATPRVAAALSYDYETRELEASRWSLASAAGQASGEASWTLGGGPVRVRADVTVADASRIPQITGGSAELRLSLDRPAPGQPLQVVLAGRGRDLTAASESLADLLGSSPTLDAALVIADGGARIPSASLRGERLMLDASGSIGREAGFDLDIDAAVQGPVAVGAVAIDGQATVAARLEGAYDAPTLRLDARAGTLGAGPVDLRAPRLRVELADLTGAPTGTVAFDAETDDGPASLSADIAYVDGALTARAITGGWSGFQVSGEAGKAANAPAQGTLSLSGLQGRLAADVLLALEDGGSLTAQATLRDQPIGDAGSLAALNVSVSGPLDALELSAAARGYAGEAFTLEASGRLERSGGTMRLTLDPRGTMGDDEISAPEPWVATLSGGETHIAAALIAGGGDLSVRLDRAGGMTELAADLTETPLSLINLVRPDPRLEGVASASVRLSGASMLEGRGRLEIDGARAPDYAPEGDFELTLTVDQGADGADVTLAATDAAGFRADIEGRAPLTIPAWPPVPRLDRAAPVALTGAADGDIGALWALVGLPVVSLAGDVDARGSLSGTMRAPAFEGEAQVAGGRLEEARIGLLLTDLNGSARLTGPRLVIERLDGGDGEGGRVTANGEVEFGGEPGSQTRVALALTGLQAVRTRENAATLSGDVVFLRDAEGARLDGDLRVDRAELSPPRSGEGAASVPTLDVVEVDRPESLAPPPAARRRALGLQLRIAADRRVFIRSNSLDTEWAFDVTITGTSAAPQIQGEARLVRGDLTLVGERFSLDSANVAFRGDIGDAELDLTARRATTDITVVARVTGTVENPDIELTSTPAYPEDEILARVLFGRASSQLSAFEAAQLASALSSLAGGGGFDLLGPLRESLGIDRLNVSASEGGRALVSGGRYIAEGVYLEVGTGVSGAAQASIEWEIRPRLELASRFGASQEASISLRWRKDY